MDRERERALARAKLERAEQRQAGRRKDWTAEDERGIRRVCVVSALALAVIAVLMSGASVGGAAAFVVAMAGFGTAVAFMIVVAAGWAFFRAARVLRANRAEAAGDE